MNYIWLVVGFILLIKGADYFVEGSSSVAKILKVPTVIIGLTIVAMGTSFPELAVSVSAGLRGANEIAVSNVVGSNLFNLLVIGGICAILQGKLLVDSQIMKRDLPMAIGGGILLLLLTMDQVFRGKFSSSALDFSGKEVIGRVDRFDGILFVILFIIYLVVLVKMALKAREEHKMTEEMVEFEKYEDDVKTLSVPKSIVLIIGGAAAIVLGGQLVVDSSSNIAASFGLSQTMIGLTICAVGTSLPELVTSVVAIKKGEDGMALGNIVGSCVFNIFFVLAISGTLNPISVLVANFYDLLFLAVTSLFLYLCSFKKKYVNRVEGVILFLLYVIYMVYVVIR